MIKTSHTQAKSPTEVQGKVDGKMNVPKEGKILPVCYRCTQVPKEGLCDGFRVQGMFFCSDCQHELFTAEQGSQEYQEFLCLIKGIFYITPS